MGRRLPLRALAFAFTLSLVVAGVVLVTYDLPGARMTLQIVAPLALGTVLAGELIVRRRPGSLRHQFVWIAALGAFSAAAVVTLFVRQMFFNAHDALMAVLLVGYSGALVLWSARRLGMRALHDLDVVCETLAAVGEGRRDVRVALESSDEIAKVGRQVDEMIDRLDREEQVRRELFAAVSHDLRTPITSLQLLATAIDDGVVGEDTRREYAARMNIHVRQLSSLIDDLFDLTRLHAHELEWSTEELSIDELVRDAVEAMRPTADAKPVVMAAELRAPRGMPRGNREQLRRVLFNLIQNAIQHTPPDGSVTVRSEDVDGAVEVEVADTGAGIGAGQRERVFEPFYRGDASRRAPGAGLGLAIARAIVEAHGGHIWLEDAAAGTRVRFRLPAQA